MANPTVTKTYQTSFNNYVASNSTVGSTEAHFSRRQLILDIKNTLIGLASSPWEVRGSSDAATSSLLAVGAGGPGTDLWVDEDDILWDTPATAHSWIVLRQTGISATFEMCFVCDQGFVNDDGAEATIVVSQAGFTGGSTTARPTATDERVLRSKELWGTGSQGTSYTFRWHLWQSTDGEVTRILIFANGVCQGFWRFEVPSNPVTGWTDPYFASCRQDINLDNAPTYEIYHDSASCLSRFSGVNTSLYNTAEGAANLALGEIINEPNVLDNTFIASEIGLASTTSTFVGRMGEVYDLWWGFTFATGVDDLGVGISTTRYFPQDGSKTFVQVAHMIFPWDGSTLMQTR